MSSRDRSDLLHVSNMKLRVCEIFKSIQGEGPSVGTPVIFVRLSWCNLGCKWCDSRYAWDYWTDTDIINDATGFTGGYSPEDEIKEMTVDEVRAEINALAREVINTVVITGGEPLMQQSSRAFVRLLESLKKERFQIEIETNGTIMPSSETVRCVDQFNVSLKLSNSGNTEKVRIKEKPCLFFASNSKTWFKFVVSEREDVEEILKIQKMFGIAQGKILLMPEGQSKEVISERSEDIVSLCMERGFRFSDRLHVRLWGKTRGV